MVANLKNGKACGGDAIPNEALKATAQVMIAKLDTLYTCCIKLGYFPKVWKRAKVVWIPKPKGGYRPISLLPAYGKVLDKLLDNRLRDYIEKKSSISENQFGFREGRDTTSAIKQLIHTINRKPPNHHALIVLLDLSNAFNMAWPPQVSEQLRSLRAPLYLQKIVASFLTDRIVYSGRVEMDMDIGCPQKCGTTLTKRITATESVSYLGVTLDPKMDFTAHVLTIRRKASKIAPRLSALLRTRKHAAKDMAKIMYDRVVLPSLIYGAEIWGHKAGKGKNKKQLLITQRMFLRSIVPAYKTTPTHALMVLAGTPPLYIEAERRALAYKQERHAVSLQIQQNRWNFIELDQFVNSSINPDNRLA